MDSKPTLCNTLLMKGDYPRNTIEAFQPDVIVIGSGLVGIAVTRQLAKASIRVLLIPGGGDTLELNSTELATGARIDLTRHEPLEAMRPRIIGGNSKLWGGRIATLDEDDFALRPWLTLPIWPISKVEIDPYLDLAARNFDTRYLDSISATNLEVEAAPGFDTPEILSDGLETWVLHRDLYSYRAKEIQNSKHILLADNYHAVNIGIEQESGRFKSVDVGRIGQETFQINSRFAIIAAGAIENSRLLLLMQRRYKKNFPGLSSQIGMNYVTHTLTRIPSIQRPEMLKVDSAAFGSLQTKRTLRLSYALKEKLGIGNAIATFTPSDLKLTSFKSISHHGVRILTKYKSGLPRKVWNYRSTLLQYLKLSLISHNTPTKQGISPYMVLWGEHIPNNQSKIILGEKLDAFGQPCAEAFLSFSEIDKLTLLETARVISNRIDKFRPSPSMLDWTQVAEVIENDLSQPNSHGHQIGGTIMGDLAKGGVTNTFGEVHGVKGLYCAGSSLFPTSGYAAPTLTAMALGIRTVDEIVAKLRL